MLTNTQRDWAQAQVGEERVTAVTGTITTSKPGSKKDEKILQVVGDDGTVEFTVSAPDSVITEMKKVETTVRLEGTITGVQLDEENGRVGLEIAGDAGSTVEWVVPERSEAEEAAQMSEVAVESVEDREVAAEREEIEFKRRIKSVIHDDESSVTFKNRILALIQSDNEIREVLGLAPRVDE